MYKLSKYNTRPNTCSVNGVIIGWYKNNLIEFYYFNRHLKIYLDVTLYDTVRKVVKYMDNKTYTYSYGYDGEILSIKTIEYDKTIQYIRLDNNGNVEGIEYSTDKNKISIRFYNNIIVEQSFVIGLIHYYKVWYANGMPKCDDKYINKKVIYRKRYDKRGNMIITYGKR